ncbi:hypothetical protein PsorP6_015240 [Peronosclerospora sorghi]|uniref:Uncharacterized protein n=1 Tax=Peronosclerospora sorghi TaxID=230839 RepID=A0ACC0VSQ1_9STRA|nr:hypothetical protein PsorP6_015240 [Peronosclerospora sorghi]
MDVSNSPVTIFIASSGGARHVWVSGSFKRQSDDNLLRPEFTQFMFYNYRFNYHGKARQQSTHQNYTRDMEETDVRHAEMILSSRPTARDPLGACAAMSLGCGVGGVLRPASQRSEGTFGRAGRVSEMPGSKSVKEIPLLGTYIIRDQASCVSSRTHLMLQEDPVEKMER